VTPLSIKSGAIPSKTIKKGVLTGFNLVCHWLLFPEVINPANMIARKITKHTTTVSGVVKFICIFFTVLYSTTLYLKRAQKFFKLRLMINLLKNYEH